MRKTSHTQRMFSPTQMIPVTNNSHGGATEPGAGFGGQGAMVYRERGRGLLQTIKNDWATK